MRNNLKREFSSDEKIMITLSYVSAMFGVFCTTFAVDEVFFKIISIMMIEIALLTFISSIVSFMKSKNN